VLWALFSAERSGRIKSNVIYFVGKVNIISNLPMCMFMSRVRPLVVIWALVGARCVAVPAERSGRIHSNLLYVNYMFILRYVHASDPSSGCVLRAYYLH